MAAIIMDGNALANKIKNSITEEIVNMNQVPGLAVILVGNDPASKVYVNMKKKDCEKCGIRVDDYHLTEDYGQDSLIKLIHKLNETSDIDGILVQLPLPKKYDTEKILNEINPMKDVDGLHIINAGGLFTSKHQLMDDKFLYPCTPDGIMRLLYEYNIDPNGKHCVIINRSNLLGKPLAMMMLNDNATVTICHSHTKDLIEECKRADILVTASAGGVKITADYIKEGAVVIDASTNRDENGKLCGDVIMSEDVINKASYITPVPGGVGPMTRAMLLVNTLHAAKVFFNKK